MKRSSVIIFPVFFIVLVFSQFMSITFISQYFHYYQWLTITLMVIYLLSGKSFLIYNKYNLKKYVLLFMLVPWLSVIPAYFSHGQSLYHSAHALFTFSLIFIFYFVLLKFNITEEKLFKILIVFSIIYTFIEMIQQTTYPEYWFASREKSETTGDLQVRLGMYKFYLTGVQIIILAAFFTWQKILEKITVNRLLIFFILSVGIYGFLARKLIFGFLFCIIISLLLKKNVKWYFWLLLILTGIYFYFNIDLILGNFINLTQIDIMDDNFIRYQSIRLYLNYFNDFLCLLFGNGRNHSHSDYGQYIGTLEGIYRLFRVDIGIVGYFNYFGLVGLMPVILFVNFVFKKWSNLPLYIKIYFLFTAIQLPIAFPLNSVISSFVFIIVLYLMEINLQKQITINTKYENINSIT